MSGIDLETGGTIYVRAMTDAELTAKELWGTAKCSVARCPNRAVFLAYEEEEEAEWWMYQCSAHAERYAAQHGFELPPVEPAAMEESNAALVSE